MKLSRWVIALPWGLVTKQENWDCPGFSSWYPKKMPGGNQRLQICSMRKKLLKCHSHILEQKSVEFTLYMSIGIFSVISSKRFLFVDSRSRKMFLNSSLTFQNFKFLDFTCI